MRTVELTTKQFQTIPGYSTKLSVSRWKGQIDALLYELEALENVEVIKQAWLKEKDRQMLLLELEVTIGNVQKTLQFRLEPVIITRSSRRYGRVEWIKEERASWKLFHDLLERKIAAARLGLVEFHHEFMSYISKQLPDGSLGTFGEFMNLVLEQQPGLEGLQLEDKREPKAVEAEMVEKG